MAFGLWLDTDAESFALLLNYLSNMKPTDRSTLSWLYNSKFSILDPFSLWRVRIRRIRSGQIPSLSFFYIRNICAG